MTSDELFDASGQPCTNLGTKLAWNSSVSGWMDILCFDYILISFRETVCMDVNERIIRKRRYLTQEFPFFSFTKVFVARSIGMFAHPLYSPSNQFYRSFKGGKVSALLISTFLFLSSDSLGKSRDSFVGNFPPIMVYLFALFPPIQSL